MLTPYIDSTLQVVLTLCDFNANADVVVNSFASVPCIISAEKNKEKQEIMLKDKIFPAFIKTLQRWRFSERIDDVSRVIASLTDCLNRAKGFRFISKQEKLTFIELEDCEDLLENLQNLLTCIYQFKDQEIQNFNNLGSSATDYDKDSLMIELEKLNLPYTNSIHVLE